MECKIQDKTVGKQMILNVNLSCKEYFRPASGPEHKEATPRHANVSPMA